MDVSIGFSVPYTYANKSKEYLRSEGVKVDNFIPKLVDVAVENL